MAALGQQNQVVAEVHESEVVLERMGAGSKSPKVHNHSDEVVVACLPMWEGKEAND